MMYIYHIPFQKIHAYRVLHDYDDIIIFQNTLPVW